MSPYAEMLDRLERRIVVSGISNDDPELALVGQMLGRTGTLPAIAEILSDPTQPEPIRMRALARAMGALRHTTTAAA